MKKAARRRLSGVNCRNGARSILVDYAPRILSWYQNQHHVPVGIACGPTLAKCASPCCHYSGRFVINDTSSIAYIAQK